MYVTDFPPADFTFVREHGTHQFPLVSGERVTAISEPSWDRFAAALEQVERPGAYVLSPELIVASPEPSSLDEVPAMVERRIDEARTLSQRMPQTTLLLGSASMTGTRIRNELLFVRNGEITGHSPKLPYMPGEAQVFHQVYDPREHQQPDRRTVGMICSDLIFHSRRGWGQAGLPGRDLEAEYVDPIGPDVRTVLISGIWITPYDHALGHNPSIEEPRFIDPIKWAVRKLMHDHPRLQDVVMADQMPPGAPGSGPVNFHARRVRETWA
jgi:hypothetical protein